MATAGPVLSTPLFATLVGSGAFQSFESAVAFLVGYTAAEYDVLLRAEIKSQRRPTPSTRRLH